LAADLPVNRFGQDFNMDHLFTKEESGSSSLDTPMAQAKPRSNKRECRSRRRAAKKAKIFPQPSEPEA
jgi:hypothetical protein